LQELPQLAERENVQSPALIVVGEVVNLANELAWFANTVHSPLKTRTEKVQKLSA